jgi:hypothetical protein
MLHYKCGWHSLMTWHYKCGWHSLMTWHLVLPDVTVAVSAAVSANGAVITAKALADPAWHR